MALNRLIVQILKIHKEIKRNMCYDPVKNYDG